MRIDVSEVKSFRECARKWKMSSRNGYHLRSRTPNPNLMFGTLMHEALHSMYLGGTFETILDNTLKELSDPQQQRVMTTILRGYYETVLPGDLEDYAVLDIEHGFSFTPPELEGVEAPIIDQTTGELKRVEPIALCGSIDMITARYDDNSVWGFEHKSAKTFRDPIYLRMDEQPRLYTEALDLWIQERNKVRIAEGLEPYKLGGILLNQCKKTVRFFQHQRDECVYTPEDRQRFMAGFCASVRRIVEGPDPVPEPGPIKCQSCDFKFVCEETGFEALELEDVLEEFGEELEVRTVDHLEEKIERPGEEAPGNEPIG